MRYTIALMAYHDSPIRTTARVSPSRMSFEQAAMLDDCIDALAMYNTVEPQYEKPAINSTRKFLRLKSQHS
jgi:hypothetical protein